MITKTTGVIVGVLSLEVNYYDGHTMQPVNEQYKCFYENESRKAIVDL
jgi:hypothetical protein